MRDLVGLGESESISGGRASLYLANNVIRLKNKGMLKPDKDFGIKAINYIVDNQILKDDGIIIYERLYSGLDLQIEGYDIKQKKYGTVGVVKIVKE